MQLPTREEKKNGILTRHQCPINAWQCVLYSNAIVTVYSTHPARVALGSILIVKIAAAGQPLAPHTSTHCQYGCCLGTISGLGMMLAISCSLKVSNL